MYYASIGILALFHHQIINYDMLKNGRKMSKNSPHYKYALFLHSIFVYFLTDIAWGFLVELGNRTLAYADTTVFFASMALSVLLWTRYVVAFLNKDNVRTKALLATGWFILGFTILHLIINFFIPSIYYFNENMEYVPKMGRFFLLGAQALMYFLVSVYTFFVSVKDADTDKAHYRAVSISGIIMTAFIAIQLFFPMMPFYTIGYFFMNCIMHVFVEEDEKIEQSREKENLVFEKEIYNQISTNLAKSYEAIYYVNIENGKYREISASDSYRMMNITKEFEDFFGDTLKNIREFVHPDDRKFAEYMFTKDAIMVNLYNGRPYSFKYRLLINGGTRYYRFTVMPVDDGIHIIVLDKDINDTITTETAQMEKQMISVTFSQIAESLASNYDVIYYVDAKTGEYTGYTSHNIYGTLNVNESGEDFFGLSYENITKMIHPQDRERLIAIINKDYLISALDRRKQISVEYRIMIDDRSQHTRLSVRKSTDGKHFIICVENIEEEIRKEQERLQALNTEKELARRDELTGIRNKTAYTELEQSVQSNIDRGLEFIRFAIAVCDLNELKKINDTLGHKAGDEYIKSSAKLLCDIFDHSPVFRIGGDEFVIFLSGADYDSRKELISKLQKCSIENRDKGEGPVIAIGMSEFNIENDVKVSEIFERADKLMYENKRNLKENRN